MDAMSEPTPEEQVTETNQTSQQALPDTLEGSLALGHQRLEAQNFVEAQHLFEHALTLEPSNVVAQHNRGYALESQGAVEAAMAAYEAVLQSPAPLAQSAFNLGALLARAGRNHEAQQAFARALALDPDFARAYINLRVLHARAGRLEEARHCYQQALEHDPSCHSAQLKLANLMAREGRWQEALGEYTRLLEDGWNVAEVYYRRGLALAAQGDEEQAIQAYQHAVDADPKHVAAHMQLALLYAQRERYDRATELLQRAADVASDDARVHYNLGNMHARQAIEAGALVNYGYADAAVRAYRRAIELDPQLIKAYYNLACVAEKISVQEGITAWEQYVNVARNTPAEQEWMAKARNYLRSLKGAESSS